MWNDDRQARKSSTAIIKELGKDPKTKKSIVIKDGRYGMYVTNGKANASLPKGTKVDEVNLDFALALINKKRK